VRLATAGFVALSLLPFLRYPANPPGAGDPSTIDLRTRLWLASLAVGVATLAAAWRVGTWLTARSAVEPVRHVAVLVTVLAGLGAMFLLPADPDAIDVPAGLLWTFRLCSLTTTAVLWFGLGAVFGLLALRAARAAGPALAALPAATAGPAPSAPVEAAAPAQTAASEA
jgi:hypothetical protein